ncbi:hypothetical protein VNO78_34431 [Psophocarpus tetragonolobus]|uniref:Uncharacterized protein n=1 Tax=Psophocarpus tetragonolobus TaxID=3891 RepID=A0AAN9NV33_PSOTE
MAKSVERVPKSKCTQTGAGHNKDMKLFKQFLFTKTLSGECVSNSNSLGPKSAEYNRLAKCRRDQVQNPFGAVREHLRRPSSFLWDNNLLHLADA